MITHNDISDLTVAAHAIKSLLDIKFTRAKERHAIAMGYASSNHLLAELKEHPIQREFDLYIDVLRTEALTKHQIKIDDALVERLRVELME
ncbi:MAG: hypothetical protein ACJAVV_003383 [Alphaproteobacteria bacterium]|jgi:hypothetical protein